MFDLPQMSQPITRPTAFMPFLANPARDHSLPFALTLADRNMGSMMAGEAASAELDRFATLVDAMHAAVMLAGDTGANPAPALIAILDRDQRLVLAGTFTDGAVAWCHPVTCAAEARAVVTEASQLRAQASRAADWQEGGLAQALRGRADALEARLVDPLWRAFAARALQLAA
jgi:hypothetical protein